MLNDSQWEDLTSENERVVDSAEFFGTHRAAVTASVAAAAPARAGTAHPSSSSDPARHGTGSWAVRSLAARTRRWRSRPS